MWLKILGPLVLAAVIFGGGYELGSAEKEEEWQLKWSQRDNADIAANLKHEKELRDKEQEYADKLNEANQNGEKLQKELEATIDNGAVITDRLQQQYDKLAAKSKRCQSSATPSGGQNTEGPADMLANLLSRSEQRATEIARYADELGIALGVCQVSYEAIRDPGKK